MEIKDVPQIIDYSPPWQDNRIPIVYIPDRDLLLIGQPGDHHWSCLSYIVSDPVNDYSWLGSAILVNYWPRVQEFEFYNGKNKLNQEVIDEVEEAVRTHLEGQNDENTVHPLSSVEKSSLSQKSASRVLDFEWVETHNDSHGGGLPWMANRKTLYMGTSEDFHYNLVGAVPKDESYISGRLEPDVVWFWDRKSITPDQMNSVIETIRANIDPDELEYLTPMAHSYIGEDAENVWRREDEGNYSWYMPVRLSMIPISEPRFPARRFVWSSGQPLPEVGPLIGMNQPPIHGQLFQNLEGRFNDPLDMWRGAMVGGWLEFNPTSKTYTLSPVPSDGSDWKELPPQDKIALIKALKAWANQQGETFKQSKVATVTTANYSVYEVYNDHGGGRPYFYSWSLDHLFVGDEDGFHSQLLDRMNRDISLNDWLGQGAMEGLAKGYIGGRIQGDDNEIYSVDSYNFLYGDADQEDVYRYYRRVWEIAEYAISQGDLTVEQVEPEEEEIEREDEWMDHPAGDFEIYDVEELFEFYDELRYSPGEFADGEEPFESSTYYDYYQYGRDVDLTEERAVQIALEIVSQIWNGQWTEGEVIEASQAFAFAFAIQKRPDRFKKMVNEVKKFVNAKVRVQAVKDPSQRLFDPNEYIENKTVPPLVQEYVSYLEELSSIEIYPPDSPRFQGVQTLFENKGLNKLPGTFSAVFKVSTVFKRFDQDDYEFWDIDRSPVVYDIPNDTVYIGRMGSMHYEILSSLGAQSETGYDKLDDDLECGYVLLHNDTVDVNMWPNNLTPEYNRTLAQKIKQYVNDHLDDFMEERNYIKEKYGLEDS